MAGSLNQRLSGARIAIAARLPDAIHICSTHEQIRDLSHKPVDRVIRHCLLAKSRDDHKRIRMPVAKTFTPLSALRQCTVMTGTLKRTRCPFSLSLSKHLVLQALRIGDQC